MPTRRIPGADGIVARPFPREDRHDQATRCRRPQPCSQRLDAGPVICAEGYVFELERRGYLQAGAFVPEVVLEHPEAVTPAASRLRPCGLRCRRGAHLLRASREAARHRPRAGSRADQPAGAGDRQGRRAGNRRAVRRRHLQHQRLRPGRPGDRTRRCARCSRSRCRWAVDAGVDFVIGETFSLCAGSADRARRRQEGGQVAVITLAMHQADVTRENWSRGRRLPAHRAGRRRRRRPQLHPRSRDDDAAAEGDPRQGDQRADGGAAGPLSHDGSAAVVPVAARRALLGAPGERPFPDRARPLHVQPLRDRRFRPRGARDWASATSACAAARARITSARSPSRSASIRRRAVTPPTCRSTRSWARTSGSSRCRRTTPTSSERGGRCTRARA